MTSSTKTSATFHSYENAIYDAQANKRDGNITQSASQSAITQKQQHSQEVQQQQLEYISNSPQNSSSLSLTTAAIPPSLSTTTTAPMAGTSTATTTINTTNNHSQPATIMTSQTCGNSNVKNVVDSPFTDLIHHGKLISHALFYLHPNSSLSLQITNLDLTIYAITQTMRKHKQ